VTFPSSHPPVPAVVRRFADSRPVRAVWVNEEGGVTFRLGSGGSGRDFVKVANARGTDFAAEARRLRWAAPDMAVRAIGAGLRACTTDCRSAHVLSSRRRPAGWPR
jgi:kanamycin kinase